VAAVVRAASPPVASVWAVTVPSRPGDVDEIGAARRRAVRDSLSVGITVGAYGVAFGAASVAAGLSVLQTALLSLLAFTGGTQFAVVGVIAGGGSGVAAVSGGLLLGARNTLYAIRLRPLLSVRGLRRWLAALGTIDESTAMAVAQRTPELSRLAFWWTAGSVWVGWNTATVLGAFGANALGDPARFGLDAVIPAAFLALVAPRLRAGPAERRVALLAALVALVLIPLTPPGVPVLAGCAGLLAAIEVPRLRAARE
jgi:predicted branched-subunit amino acid permease